MLSKELKDFVKGIFTDNGVPSSSRVFGAICALTTVFCIVWVTVKTTHIPEAAGTAALTAYGTSHYLVNRATNAWGKSTPDPAPGGVVDASEDKQS